MKNWTLQIAFRTHFWAVFTALPDLHNSFIESGSKTTQTVNTQRYQQSSVICGDFPHLWVLCVTFHLIFLFSPPSRLAWQQMKPLALFGDPAITQYPSAPSAQARLSEINLNLPKQCCHVTVHLTGIEVFSSCPVSRWDPPSIPLPTHSEQSKPRAQAGKTVMILWVWAQIKHNWGSTLKSVFGRYTDTEPLGDLSWHEIGRSCIETVQDRKKIIDAPSH